MKKILIMFLLLTSASIFAKDPAGRFITCKLLKNNNLLTLSMELKGNYLFYTEVHNKDNQWVGMLDKKSSTSKIAYLGNYYINSDGHIQEGVKEDTVNIEFQERKEKHALYNIKFNDGLTSTLKLLLNSRYDVGYDSFVKAAVVNENMVGYQTDCQVTDWN